MYAVVRSGGKQYRVEPGAELCVEKLNGAVGESVVFSDVLLFADGDKVEVGRPLVDGATVSGEILEQAKGPKQVIFKKIRRQGKQLKKGHRQAFTRVQVKDISLK